jgi:AraC-like DNA-binding protein
MARHFLDIAAQDLTDRREAVSREFAIGADVLADGLRGPDIFAQLDGLLERRLTQSPPRLSAIDVAAREIAARNGAIRIEDLVNGYGKGRRQFERDFLRAVGITAKQFAVIARFRFAAARLSSDRSLAATAAEAGYADQSHMVRDFRRLGGSSPSGWAGHVAFVQDL